MEDLNAKCPASIRKVAVQLPIVDVTTPAVFQTLRDRGDRINPLYARGHSRVGCYPCVLAGKKDFALAARDPHGRENIKRMKEAINIAWSEKPPNDTKVIFEHDLGALLEQAEADPFGFNYAISIMPDEPAAGCSFCED